MKLRLFCKKRFSPSCVRGRPLQLCAQRVFGDKGNLQLCAWLKDLKGYTAECTDQNCGFCKELNKTQFCGRNS